MQTTAGRMTDLSEQLGNAIAEVQHARPGGAFTELSDATWKFGRRWQKVTKDREEQLKEVADRITAMAQQLEELDQGYADALN